MIFERTLYMAIIKLVIPLYVYGHITGVLSKMDDSYWLNEITSSAVIITKQKNAAQYYQKKQKHFVEKTCLS